ncbi:MAG: hypothetical protein LBH96_03645 [Candidatus Peribacteria bacterium]|jgi:hypothetical protein|nr:hypothetical protein [Candidatus Peribacteria bacterium]
MKINSAIYDTWKAANASGILNHNPEGRHNFVKYASHGAEKFPYLTDKLAELLKIDLPSSTYNI